MYPVIRLIKEFVKFRDASPLGLFDTHISHHRCWPWDLDFMMELNNGRTLTLYDLGRMILAKRQGLLKTLKREGWALTVAGSSVRYRRRVRLFDLLEMRTRLIGWDDKFFYLEQSMWKGDDCTSHILLRMAMTDKNGLVRTDRTREAIGHSGDIPALPDWVTAWSEAEALRPWPPMQDAEHHKSNAA
ncbi:acyl-CoA thioesterase [Qingshengfaniella alkalisoli]|uniref:Acyl-CoA thioesterase n=1 Tax=Qingshengfaniella alkalisoli TaxID=2599296 RepID=A0A5B8I7Y3_9RHOB|nr:acyl-CoA thioesterase [Qingshengfaniella alkalisoli]QDY70005.1 acyl-CoA thioesterase [Qingshengfaniella alkalisoli]